VELGEQSRRNITTPEGIQLRLNRSIQVEGAFGVLKYDRHFKRFLTRGKHNISIELYLLCLSFNINKLHAKSQSNRLQNHLFEKMIS
jgi:transposase